MFYKFAVFILKIVTAILYKVEVTGKDNILNDGPLIFCSNHIGNYDPILVVTNTKRKVSYMGKKELFENFFLNKLFIGLGAFPVDRNSKADIQSAKKAIDILKLNGSLGIFFQGTRSKEIDADKAKSGVSLFALKSKSPIIPVYLNGNYKFRGKMTVTIGKPIYLDKYFDKKITHEILDEITAEITSKIKELEQN